MGIWYVSGEKSRPKVALAIKWSGLVNKTLWWWKELWSVYFTCWLISHPTMKNKINPPNSLYNGSPRKIMLKKKIHIYDSKYQNPTSKWVVGYSKVYGNKPTLGGYEVPLDLIDRLTINTDYTPDEDDLHYLSKELMRTLNN